MNYVQGRDIHDADSHLLEHPDWLKPYLSSAVRQQVPSLDLHGLEAEATQALAEHRAGTRPIIEDAAELMTHKNWAALGAFDTAERSQALNLLGFKSQLVFSTYSHLGMIDHGGAATLDPDVLYEIVDGHNRGVVDFCAADQRLLPVGFVAPHLPERAIAATQRALDLGCAGIELPSLPCGDYSLTHTALDPLYAMLQERGRPLLFHVGGGGRLVHPTFAATGRAPEQVHHDRETLIPSLTYMGIPAPLEMALAALILDGVFERFPGLRCGVIEQGAIWVPGFLRRLDAALEEFGRPRQRASLSLSPSEYFVRQIRVTPFPFEDIEWLIHETGPELYLFGTDYPHDEGGETPLSMFDEALESFPNNVRDAIYWRNFEDLMANGLPETLRVQAVFEDSFEDETDEVEVLRLTGESLAVHRKKVLLRLLVREAAERYGLIASDDEVEAAVDEFRASCDLYDVEETQEWLGDAKITYESLCRVMRDSVLADKLYLQLQDEVTRNLPEQIGVATARLRRKSKTVSH